MSESRLLRSSQNILREQCPLYVTGPRLLHQRELYVYFTRSDAYYENVYKTIRQIVMPAMTLGLIYKEIKTRALQMRS